MKSPRSRVPRILPRITSVVKRPAAIADHAMRYLAAPELSEVFIFQPAILLADL